MRALTTRVVTVLAALGLVVFSSASVLAHDVLYPGTVLAVEAARIQIKTIDPDTKKDVQLWFAVDTKTKVKRGEASVKYAGAGIRKGERIVVVVNHDDGNTAATEIRLAAAGQTPPVSGGLRVAPLQSPAGPESGEPNLSVSSRGVLMSWVEQTGRTAALKFSERTTSGWTPPRAVASGDNWFVNWADVPSVLRLTDGTLVGQWLQKSGPSTYAYDVRLAQSKNDGRTWSESFTPHHDGTKAEHGFASLFQVPGMGLGAVWLDGRATANMGGAMTLRYGAFDGDGKQVADQPVDTRVCDCCPTTAAVTAQGPLVAFRNRTDDEIRDIYVSRLVKGAWTEPKAVHDDGWQISGCPVNGPALSARGRDVAIAWFTGKVEPGRAFVAFSSDAGESFGAPIRVDTDASLGRVDVELLPDGTAMATWIEMGKGGAEFRARKVSASGVLGSPQTIAKVASSRSSGYPRMARQGAEFVFAWTEVTPGAAGKSPTTRVVTAVAR